MTEFIYVLNRKYSSNNLEKYLFIKNTPTQVVVFKADQPDCILRFSRKDNYQIGGSKYNSRKIIPYEEYKEIHNNKIKIELEADYKELIKITNNIEKLKKELL